MLLPDALNIVENLFIKYNDVDFFYLNSHVLDYKFLENFPKPFDSNNLPEDMPKLSKKENEMECHFWDLIDGEVSFDFLLGNFLNIFKRQMVRQC